MKTELISIVKSEGFHCHLSPREVKFGYANFMAKLLKIAFGLFKSGLPLFCTAKPIKEKFNPVTQNLLINRQALISYPKAFSILSELSKPNKTERLEKEKKTTLNGKNAYSFNTINFDFFKSITRFNFNLLHPEVTPGMNNELNQKKEDHKHQPTPMLLKSFNLEIEKLSKTASFAFNVAQGWFELSEYVLTLLQVPSGKEISSFQDLLFYLNPKDQSGLTQQWEQLITDGTDLEIETKLSKDNTTWLKIKAILLSPENNKSLVMGTIQDITEFKEKEKELLTQKIKAEQATEVKSEFVSLMSHEIRTPLNAILGLTYLLLQEKDLDGKHKENLESIQFSSETLMGLINSTLDYSRMEAGKIELEKIDFSLKNILIGIHKTLYHRAAEKNLQFNLNLDADTPAMVAGDSARLSQILNNLTSNAIKFTQTGSVTLSTKVLYESDQEYVIEFAVADTGVGIPEHKQEEIFESFVQASTSTHRQYGGTGLGLAITKKIIELHKGKIKLISAPGKGSTFKVWLRYAKPSLITESFPTEALSLPTGELAGIKILVVDDNALNQMVARKILQMWQVEVETAENGAQALEKIKKQAYDLVLMDINMPVMNGFEALTEIRKFNLSLPVIALTASAREEEKNKVLAIGGNDYLSKPFVPEELYQKLVEHLAITSSC